MGSDNSKLNRKSEEIGNDALRFGPIGTQETKSSAISEYALNQQKKVDRFTQVNSQVNVPPPPAYSQIDPMQKNSSDSILAATSQSSRITPPVPKVAPRIIPQNSTAAQKQVSIKTGNNVQNKMQQPSMPTNSFVSASSNIRIGEIKIKAENMQQINKTKSTAPSPIKAIDLEHELPKIKKEILSEKNAAAVSLNKDLNKNKSLSEVRKSLVNNEYLSDIHVTLNSKMYYGHKLFLVTASPLFYHHFQVNGYNEVILDEYGIDEETLLTILAFCYTGSLPKLTDDNVLSIFHAADKLKVSQAFTNCCSYINSKINSDGVFIVFEKAIELSNELFQKKCLEYIKKNEDKCFNSNGFFKISLTSLITILGKCDYPTEKSNGIIEKWNNGPIAVKTQPSKNNSNKNEKQTGTKKKDNQHQQKSQQQAKNQQQQSAKSQKNQKPKNKQQPNKNEAAAQITNMTNIPSLIDLDIPSPPFAEGFHSTNIQRIDSISNLSDDLITFEDDNDSNYGTNELVCVDDDANGRVRVIVRGPGSTAITEFSRIDFIAKRSFLLHEVWFTDNMLKNSTEIRVSISIFEEEKRSDVHSRTIKNRSDTKFNFIKFSRQPLKIFIGQKFFIKLNFAEQCMRKHIDPQNLSSIDFMELRRDGDVRKYFNCISKLVVSEIN